MLLEVILFGIIIIGVVFIGYMLYVDIKTYGPYWGKHES